MKINLFTNHYKCGEPKRQAELDFCLKTNINSGYFSEIINFSGRITYNDFFKHTARFPNDINILANADIYFNDTILKVKEMKDNECYCITRWELDEDGNICRFRDKHAYNKEAKEKYSQDVWVIKGKARQVWGDFQLGRRGCDNRIAHELVMAHYKVSNPCEDIQCIHKHQSAERVYTIEEKVYPPYKFIEPGDEVTHVITRRRSIR